MNETVILREGLGFPESTRWREDRVWLCDWGSGEVLAVADDGAAEAVVSLPADTLPFSIDWLPDGRLLIVDGPRRRLLVHDGAGGGAPAPYAELPGLTGAPFNEIVVDGGGNAYVDGGPGAVVLVRPDGGVETVADGLRFPNGMALVDDGATLVVADSHAGALTAFAVRDDATLGSDRWEWAALEHAPDGICADADGAIWVASVPGERCVRVREGGEVLDAVAADRGCFSCMLGGADGRTLFVGAARWRGMATAMSEGPGTTGRLLAVPGRPAAHAGRP